jgi:hypothetical protein
MPRESTVRPLAAAFLLAQVCSACGDAPAPRYAGSSGAGGRSGAGPEATGGAAVAGNGGAGPTGSAREICDGSSGLRFAASIPWNGDVEIATGLLYEHGVAYVMVDGLCQFAVWSKAKAVSPEGVWSSARVGTLDAATEAELAAGFDYDAWPKMAGSHGPDERLSDAPTLIVFDGERRLTCDKPCSKTAPKLDAALENMQSWVQRLRERGADADGPVRLRVFDLENLLGDERGAWPLASPVTDYVVDGGDAMAITGPAHVISGADAGLLRAQRTPLSERFFSDSAAGVEHEDPARMYGYAFRDVVPFEDADGRIPGFDGE